MYKKEHMVTGTYRLLARGASELYVQTEAMLLFENGSGLCAGSSSGGKHGKKPVGEPIAFKFVFVTVSVSSVR